MLRPTRLRADFSYIPRQKRRRETRGPKVNAGAEPDICYQATQPVRAIGYAPFSSG